MADSERVERVVLEITTKGTARVVSREFAEVGQAAKESHGSVETLKRALEFAGVAVTVGEVVKVMSEVSGAMARAQVVSGATAQQMVKLREEISRLGGESTQGVTAAARAFEELSRAHLATAESTGALKQALTLAEVAGVDAGVAAHDLGKIMQAFGLDARNAGQVVDQLTTSLFSGQLGLEELTHALSRSAGEAKTAGLGLKEVEAVVLTLGKSGQDTRRLIFELGRAFEALESPTQKERAAFEVAHLSADRLKPSLVGLKDAAEELGKETVTLESLGVRGGAVLDALGRGAEDVDKLTKALDESEGAAERAAKTLSSSLEGAFKQLRSAAEELISSFGVNGLAGAIELSAKAIHNISISVSLLTEAIAAYQNALQRTFEVGFLSSAQLEELDKLRAAEARGKAPTAAPAATAFAGERLAPAPPSNERIVGLPGLELQTEGLPAFPARATREKEPAKAASEEDQLRQQAKLHIDELRNAQKNYNLTVDELNRARDAGNISQEQYNLELGKTIRQYETINSASTVLKGRFLEVDTSIGAVAGQIGDVLVNSIDRASDALADFANSGFQDVRKLRQALADLLQSIAKEIEKIIVKELIMLAIKKTIEGVSGYFGGGSLGVEGASGGGSLPAGTEVPAEATGGEAYPGRPILVGERGPELFTPSGMGTITPNSQVDWTGGGAAPSIKIVNVVDRRETDAHLNSPDGDKTLLNFVQRNRNTLRTILS